MLRKKDYDLKFLFAVAFVVVLFLFSIGNFGGCATTPKGKVVETQNTFKAMLKTYNMEMDAQKDEAVKQEWRETFPPLFEKANKALKAYESAVQQGFGQEQKMELVLLIKNQILLEFIRENIEFTDPKEVK